MTNFVYLPFADKHVMKNCFFSEKKIVAVAKKDAVRTVRVDQSRQLNNELKLTLHA